MYVYINVNNKQTKLFRMKTFLVKHTSANIVIAQFNTLESAQDFIKRVDPAGSLLSIKKSL